MAIHYDSAEGLLANGSQALHAHVAETLEAALGGPLPQMEVRFHGLSLSADYTVADSAHRDRSKAEPTTIASHLRQRFACGAKRVVRKHILTNVSGVFQPGTLTLVLGQPGSGKSALLKALSGRFPMASNITREGDVTYNGAPLDHALERRLPQLVGYVTQQDTHFPTLTVQETLAFAHARCGGAMTRDAETHLARGTPEQNERALAAARAMDDHLPALVAQQFGLQHCQDTVVGNAMLRGISGGEKKRVTTGEMAFGTKFVTLLDEISTGLDSAATFDIINTQRSMAKALRKTVVISLLQPAPEVFALFDNVLLLHEGRVAYFGPREDVLPHFAQQGFECPRHRDVADFLVDLGTDQQHQYEVGGRTYYPRRADEFTDLFERSPIHEKMLETLHAPHD